MTAAPLITLLTDFGLDDPYVGVMKAVLLRHCPDARIVDLTHAIAPFDKPLAAFWIERVLGWFPPATLHLVVVDPGVGSDRNAIAIFAHDQYFVGPDNGILSGVYASDHRAQARQILAGSLGLPTVSRTFHGRDVFAPVVARLATGSLNFEEIGPRASTLCDPVLASAVETATGVVGQIVSVDRFGNALTNLSGPVEAARFEACVAGHRLPILETYSDGELGQIFALFGSFGALEVAMCQGSAAAALGLSPGLPVEIRPIA